MTGGVTIRPFATSDDYRACVALQEDTWGTGFSERVAPAILKVSQLLGGVAAGAYDEDDALVGFVFGMTGLRDGEVVHWSDMLAVRPEVRDAGLGRRLKAFQRGEMMTRGVEKMYWTFDPLQSRNAYLNFSRLGVVAREYVRDMYGDSDSPLHRGIGTDRLVALWLLSSDRVGERVAAKVAVASSSFDDDTPVALAAERGGTHPRPGAQDLTVGNDLVRVAIPSDIVTLLNDDLVLAQEWRAATRHVLSHYLESGYEIREFVRGPFTSDHILARRTDLHE